MGDNYWYIYGFEDANDVMERIPQFLIANKLREKAVAKLVLIEENLYMMLKYLHTSGKMFNDAQI